jgi:hypothetical protein
MDLPPSSHFIYIPVVLILGISIGFVLGGRATRDAMRVEEQKAAERERRKAERRAAVKPAPTSDDASKQDGG